MSNPCQSCGGVIAHFHSCPGLWGRPLCSTSEPPPHMAVVPTATADNLGVMHPTSDRATAEKALEWGREG